MNAPMKKVTKAMQKALYKQVDAASYDIFLLTTYTQRSKGVSIAPAWASDIAFSLTRLTMHCNNIATTINNLIHFHS